MDAMIFLCRASEDGSKRRRFCLMVMFSIILCGPLYAQDVPDMFPDSIGNYWQYEYDLPDWGMADYKSVTDTIAFNKMHYFVFETKIHEHIDEMFLRKDSLGNIWQYYQNCNEEVLWFDFSLPDNSVYRWAPAGRVDSFKVRVKHPIKIETPAGTFENCTEFFFQIPAWRDTEQWYVFAPDVGLVKEQHTSVSQFLSSAFINGKTITRIDNELEAVRYFSLEQNFPNPFNPSTSIPFILPIACFVTVEVFDILGREVAMLANERMTSGQHQVIWKPVGLPNGIYFYRLETDAFVETKKMIFLE